MWDGNETWLVLGGGGLLAAFPLAYGMILPALYAPIVAMLLALIFRGVAFEFRWRDPRAIALLGHRPSAAARCMAAFAQGVTLGALLQGIAVEDRAYAGGWCDWLTPFSLLVGVSLVCGYALLGSTWLIMKSEGTLQARCYRLAFGLGIGTHRRHRRGERRDAVPERRLLAALVRLAAGPVHRRGAAAGRRRHLVSFQQPQPAPHTTRRS